MSENDARVTAAFNDAVRTGNNVLDLHGLGLETLPEFPKTLRALRQVDLSGNQLSALPTSLWALHDLQELALSGNRLQALDPGIGRLTHLKRLDLSANRLEAIPLELAACTALTYLDLFDNRLTELPPAILDLPALEFLSVARNRLARVPKLSGRWTKLQSLDVSGNALTHLPPGLGTLGALRTLNLSGNRLDDLSEVAQLVRLEQLFADDNLLREAPEALAPLASLRVAGLLGNPSLDVMLWMKRFASGDPVVWSPATILNRVRGGYEPGIRSSDAPARTLDCTLSVDTPDAMSEVLDLYFKQFADLPLALVDGDHTVDLTTIGRDGARRLGTGEGLVAGDAGQPMKAPKLMFRPMKESAQIERSAEFVARALNNITGIAIAQVTRSTRAKPPSMLEPMPSLVERGLESIGASPELQKKASNDASEIARLAPTAARVADPAAAALVPDTEPVDVAVFCPPHVAPAATFLIQVFLYPPGAEEAVARDAVGVDESATRRATYSLPMDLPRGTRVDLRLDAPQLTVAEPDAMLTWRGRATSVQFEASVPAGVTRGDLLGRVRVAVAGIPAGTLRFQVSVSEVAAAPPAAFQPVVAQKFTSAFVSYSSKDRAEVLRRVQAFKIAGLKVFQDVLDLSPGDRWERELYREIDDCDVFLLFWSHSAAASPWVAKEIEYALARKGADEDRPPNIQPVPLEAPSLAPPPENLRHLHFNDALLAQITLADSTRPKTDVPTSPPAPPAVSPSPQPPAA